MKCLAIIGCALGLALAPAAFAQELASVKYDGKRPVTLRYQELTVTIDSAPGPNTDQRMPVVKGRYRDGDAFTIELDDAEADSANARARVVWLDRSAAFPQVLVTAFTGGAHCCEGSKIATMTAPGAWRVLDARNLDGDEGYTLADLDHDGAAELISIDNDFLYAFSSYADSFAPTRIAKLVGTDITDVTGDAKYRDFLRGRLHDMEAAARKQPDLWHSNGFLGGWVAAKSLVGEVDEAWSRMLKLYDRKSDWPLQECTVNVSFDKCPEDKLRDLTFPEALRKLMADGDYPLPKSAR